MIKKILILVFILSILLIDRTFALTSLNKMSDKEIEQYFFAGVNSFSIESGYNILEAVDISHNDASFWINRQVYQADRSHQELLHSFKTIILFDMKELELNTGIKRNWKIKLYWKNKLLKTIDYSKISE